MGHVWGAHVEWELGHCCSRRGLRAPVVAVDVQGRIQSRGANNALGCIIPGEELRAVDGLALSALADARAGELPLGVGASHPAHLIALVGENLQEIVHLHAGVGRGGHEVPRVVRPFGDDGAGLLHVHNLLVVALVLAVPEADLAGQVTEAAEGDHVAQGVPPDRVAIQLRELKEAHAVCAEECDVARHVALHDDELVAVGAPADVVGGLRVDLADEEAGRAEEEAV
ncbi:1-aminocyclopropane-1-carboxylate synthase 8 [Babesia caballi]|uniref:1-aminocyclopropane-1-carboxylate synthase 8 n=1 Tax=Babesia caballi TaxID=5871 RepID=A0AAV4LLM5_BABCB|nr:1-aminocyclopropane-1-carboxylate synthase 8 [Babesia caballi]